MQHRLRGSAQLALEVGAVVDAHVVGVRVLHLVHCGVEAERGRLAAAPHLVRGRVRVRVRVGVGVGVGVGARVRVMVSCRRAPRRSSRRQPR